MAGRGTDILLGGNPEFLAKEILKRKVLHLKRQQRSSTRKL